MMNKLQIGFAMFRLNYLTFLLRLISFLRSLGNKTPNITRFFAGFLIKFRKLKPAFLHRKNFSKRPNRGLSLIECAMAVLIVGSTIITVLEISANTVAIAGNAVDNRLGSLLASEIIARECLGQFPEETDAETSESSATEDVGEVEYYSSGSQEVDTEKYSEQYKNFSYEVFKFYEDIDIETELSDDAEEEDEEQVPEEEEEAKPTIRIVRIRVVITFPKKIGFDERKTPSIETYLRPPKFASEEGTNPE